MRFIDYLELCANEGAITGVTKELCLIVWHQLLELDFNGEYKEYYPEPSACPGANNNILMCWGQERYYFEIEVFPDGRAEFFYRDREKDITWDSEYKIGEPFPKDAHERLLECQMEPAPPPDM